MAATAGVLLLGACQSPGTPEFSAGPAPELAADPDNNPIPFVIDGDPPDAPQAGPPGDASSSSTTSSGPVTSAPAGSAPQSTTAEFPPVAARTVVVVDDAAGDQGLFGPDHADLRRTVIEDVGDDVRVTVQFGGPVPDPPADGEVIGVGVDFYVGPDEAEYQLFAVGNADGWRGFVSQPEGFIEFPGAFRIGGDLMQFEVPWDAIGGETEGAVQTFIDWAKPDSLGITANSTRDTGPDDSRAPYRP